MYDIYYLKVFGADISLLIVLHWSQLLIAEGNDFVRGYGVVSDNLISDSFHAGLRDLGETSFGACHCNDRFFGMYSLPRGNLSHLTSTRLQRLEVTTTLIVSQRMLPRVCDYPSDQRT